MPQDDRLLLGANAIAKHLGITPRQTYELRADGWPIFKVRNKLAARPSKLREHIEKLEGSDE